MSKKFITACLTALLVASVALPSIAAAVTVSSTEESSTAETQTTASSELPTVASSIPEPETVTSESIEEVEEEVPTVEEEIVEEDYDQRELTEEEDETGHPFLTFEEKKVKKEFSIKGQLQAVINEENEMTTQTKLTALILQRRKDDGDWEERKAFEVSEEGQVISTDAYNFDYDENESEAGTYDYRLAADYSIESQQESVTRVAKHKGHYSLGQVVVEEVQTSSFQIPRNLNEMGTMSGIAPFASWTNPNTGGFVTINASETSLTLSLRYTYSHFSYTGFYAIISDNKDFVWQNRWDGTNQNALFPTGEFDQVWKRATIRKEIGGDREGTTNTLRVTDEVIATNLTPGKTYYVWLFDKVQLMEGGFDGGRFQITPGPPPADSPAQSRGVLKPYYAKTKMPLSFKPVKDDNFAWAISQEPKQIWVNGDQYYGDVHTDPGIVQAKTSTTNWDTKLSTLGHNTGTGTEQNKQYHNGTVVDNLIPGTFYQVRVGLKDANGKYVYKYDYDAKTVVSLTANPTVTQTDTTAKITGEYEAATEHPDSVVQIMVGDTVIGTNKTPQVPYWYTGYTVNKGSGKGTVSFVINGLNPKTEYTISYAVRNSSNQLSNVVTTQKFKTNAVPLSYPEAPQGEEGESNDWARAWTINHEPTKLWANNGTYFGEAHADDGIVQVKTSDTGWTTRIHDLEHQTGTGTEQNPKKYGGDGMEITGLYPGTIYQVRVGLKDATTGQPVYNTYTGRRSRTVVSLDADPTITKAHNTASITGDYKAATEHPYDNTKENYAQITVNGIQIGTSETPQVPYYYTDYDVNKRDRKVSFNIKGLRPSTNYKIKYAVRNSSGYLSNIQTAEFDTDAAPLALKKPTISNVNIDSSNNVKATLDQTGYTGGISTTVDDGLVFLRKGENGTEEQVQNKRVTHGTDQTEGSYAIGGLVLDGLAAGTLYQARVKIPDANGTLVPSEWSKQFATPNRIGGIWPGRPNNHIPQHANDAKLQIGSGYEFTQGAAALPLVDNLANVRVQIRERGGAFVTVTATPNADGVYLSDFVLTEAANGGKLVNVNINNLKTKTDYQVKWQVKNEGGWSNEAALHNAVGEWTTTAGQKVEFIQAPNYNQADGNPNSIEVKSDKYISSGEFLNDPPTASFIAKTKNIQSVIDGLGITNNAISGYDISGGTSVSLIPGSKYEGWWSVKGYAGKYVANGTSEHNQFVFESAKSVFYTKNELRTPTVATPIPASRYNASAEISGKYTAGGTDGPVAQETGDPSHPHSVKVEITDNATDYSLNGEGGSWQEVTTTSAGPKLESAASIDTANKKINFKIVGLEEGKEYFVRYRVMNGPASGSPGSSDMGWTKLDVAARTRFTTDTRSNNIYFVKRPQEFNFGVIDIPENNNVFNSLSHSASDNFDIELENVGVTSEWKFLAKFNPLEKDGSTETISGAKITLNKKLWKATPVNGGWSTPTDESSLFVADPLSSTIEINSDAASSKELFVVPNGGQGNEKYTYEIDPNSVKLNLLANSGERGQLYKGQMQWIVDLGTP
ncbi:hypothetical protein JZO70_12035 [Enterococcus sp. 669A]|uniref:Fibronectin type-III domain-containing protein n=1 Tax=Candidatus Enterococcus moelleringii TaxID=2815325 RepID=A0ABS3LB77_9ENTE|nr:hypothetical protein [Enterococcus sp. 669A]MBO1306897.1 hypothetical protein [Enterococcus sp. 669A]